MSEIKTCKAAGVTFQNDPADGGRPRQEILHELMKKSRYIGVWLRPRKFYRKETGVWEDSIKLIEQRTGQMIGFIPKNLVPEYKNISDMIGELNCVENTIGVRLTMPEEPSQKLYWTIRRHCERTGDEMPAYDKRAYMERLHMIQKNKEN